MVDTSKHEKFNEPFDPHESKMAPDDPRLRIQAPRGRVLKKGPAVALVIAVGGTVAISLILALVPASKSSEPKKQEGATTPQAPIVPESIRNAAVSTRTAPVRSTSRSNGRGESDAGSLEDFPAETQHVRREGRSDPRKEQETRARGAGLLFESIHTRVESKSPPSPSSREPLPNSASASTSQDFDPNLQSRKNAFLEPAGTSTDVLKSHIEHPQTPYEIQAGTIVPAVLITAINSDLPGPVIGQVRENVYDSVSGNYLLIPQGARLLATYDSMVAWGQERVLVCWSRLIFPNGDSLRLACMPAADLTGAAGLTDEVNEHWGRILKGVGVASLLAATTHYVAGSTDGANPTVAQTWARGGAQQIGQSGKQITDRNVMVQPTITVRPGLSVNVMITKDIVFQGPYAD